MKKNLVLSVISIAALTLSFSSIALAEDNTNINIPKNDALIAPNPAPIMANVFAQGTVSNLDKVNKQFTLVVDKNDPMKNIIINIADNSKIIDNKTGISSNINSLKDGGQVVLWHSPIMTKSLPPITNAQVILINPQATKTPANYMEVNKITKNEDGTLIFLNANQDMLITINKDTIIRPLDTKNIVTIKDIKVGSKLLARYDQVALSYPGQAFAQEVILFNQDNLPKEDCSSKLQCTGKGNFQINGKSLNLNPKEACFQKNGQWMVPIRKSAQELGYQVKWDSKTKTTSLVKNKTTVLTANAKNCIIKNGVTFINIDALNKICK
ncbi:MAG: stalk domain-containing protein [Clostridiales bacterium]